MGAHVSTAGGLSRAVANAAAIGAEVVQIFPSSPRQWAGGRYGEEEARAFGRELERRRVPLFVHAIYLINLASPDPELRRRSAGALRDALRFGAAASARGVVTHVGSHRGEGVDRGVENVADAVAAAAQGEPGLPRLLLEVGAGAGQSLGRTSEEMGRLVEAVRDRGLSAGVCLDTAHLFAAGYEVRSQEGIDAYLAAVAGGIGADALGLVHLNDSRSALGSGADRHENLWEGEIGRDGLTRWLRHPALAEVPFVLEVPGFNGDGPDRKNVRRAKLMRSRARS